MITMDNKIECQEKTIGKLVKIGDGTEIICEKLFLGDGVIIGKNSNIKGKIVRIGNYTILEENFKGNGIELFEIGKRCRIKSNSTIKSRYVKISDNVRTFGAIEVGGGGWEDPDSKFIVGNGCQIGENCFINTARPVIFKDKSALAIGSSILTHGFWQSVLEGYSATYGPVTLGENSWVTVNCTVLPNVTIGDNSIVAAGSVVTKNVPPNCLVGGVPAKVIRENYPTKLTQEQKEKIILNIIDKYVPFLEVLDYGVKRDKDGSINFKDKENKKYLIVFDKFSKDLKVHKNKRILVLGFNLSNYKIENTTFFNLNKLVVSGKCDKESERFRNHLRRQGIVFDFVDYPADNYASKYYCIFD